MGDKIIAAAIPFFFGFIALEWLLARRQKQNVLRFNDAISDLSCGIGNQVTGLMMFGFFGALYKSVYDSFHLFDLDPSDPFVLVIALVFVDFAYYWWHRASHRINWIWAAHVVHHHSQDYNLAVALRQAWFTRHSLFLFYIPLAVLGVPPGPFIVADLVDTLYQFFIHTRTVKKLGPLEWFINTPSHHRAHHGINPEYIDKNYAGIFIIWDRMFATFEEEKAEVVYGTVQPLKSWDPIWANLHYWRDLVVLSRRGDTLLDKAYAFFAPPEWTPQGDKSIPPVDAKTFVKWETTPVPHAKKYVSAHFLVVTFALVYLLAENATLSKVEVIASSLLIVWCTHSFTSFLSGRRWAGISEALRLIVTSSWLLYFFQSHTVDALVFQIWLVSTLLSLTALWHIFGPGGAIDTQAPPGEGHSLDE